MDANKANTYSAIISVATIYFLLFIYIVHYYREDFRQVFCRKKVASAPQIEKKHK